jgi:hypothetical protein
VAKDCGSGLSLQNLSELWGLVSWCINWLELNEKKMFSEFLVKMDVAMPVAFEVFAVALN